MNRIIIPEDSDVMPDAILAEFARRGNRIGILEEVYRRANNGVVAEQIAVDRGIDTGDIEGVVDVAMEEFRDHNDEDMPETERLFLLRLSYGHVVDDIIEKVERVD